MTVNLRQEDFQAMVAHAEAGLPNEACGLIAGKVRGNLKVVEKVYLLSNPDRSPEHFSVDQKEQLAGIRDMRARGLVLLGNFHSHPHSPARPSEEDIRLAFDPKVSYIIISLAEEIPVMKAFEIVDGKVTLQTLVIMP